MQELDYMPSEKISEQENNQSLDVDVVIESKKTEQSSAIVGNSAADSKKVVATFFDSKKMRNIFWGFGVFIFIFYTFFLELNLTNREICCKGYCDSLPRFVDVVIYFCVSALPFLVIGLAFYLWIGKSELTIDRQAIQGRAAFGKSFILSKQDIRRVKESPIYGLTITDNFSKNHSVKLIRNLDYIVEQLQINDYEVFNTVDKPNGIIEKSKPEAKKKKFLHYVTIIIFVVAIVLMAGTLFYYTSVGNWEEVKKYYTSTYPWGESYEDWRLVERHIVELEEIFTFWISIFLFLVSSVLFIIYESIRNSWICVSKSGVVGRTIFGKAFNIPFSSINYAKSSNLLSKVIIKTNGKSKSAFMIENHPNIVKLINETISELKVNKNNIPNTVIRGPRVVVQSNQSSSTDELIKLKELLDSGVITQEDFDAKKKQILGI